VADFDVGSEHHIPETIGNPEVSLLIEMMMEHVPALQAIGVGARLDAPVVEDVVDALETEIADHHSSGEASRGHRTHDEPRGEDKENSKRAEAHPYWRADQGALFIMVRLVHLFDVWRVVEYVAMERIFDQRPEAYPREERDQPDRASLRRSPPQHDRRQDDDQHRVNDELPVITNLAQPHDPSPTDLTNLAPMNRDAL
jgi:hypothetical protein